MSIAQIVELDIEVDFESTHQYKWIIGSLNLDDFEKIKEQVWSDKAEEMVLQVVWSIKGGKMKICVLTGKRGGYGAMRPMLRLMRDDPDIRLHILACDMHTNKEFGRTISEIEEDFECIFPIISSDIRLYGLGGIATLVARHLTAHKTDLLMLYGDRGESLAAAMVATEMCIPIAHLQGGDNSGTMDNRRRYALTQLADINFVSNEQAEECVKDTTYPGQASIHVVGDSHLDPIFEKDYDDKLKIMQDLDLHDGPIIIVLHHPDPTDKFSGYEYIHRIMDAIDDVGRQIVMIYPCSDPGWEGVVEAINWFKGHENIQIHKNLPSRTFLGLMNIADCIVGNSSCGIIEAPYLDLPCVNVGHRQDGRLRGDNVIQASHKVSNIGSAFAWAMEARPPFEKLYGNGATGKRIINHLKEWAN
jgi:UDP-N-acetylglucosamine 2-epimerase (non-hydrolysing)/GDP/UDP-N,N'-diacetylbacillosamine 2-epimerase (hydrolysing)|tara:strand:- start:17102 stop:18352 length:1251 start_codon:yes stop_codon:yes gene_type:complete